MKLPAADSNATLENEEWLAILKRRFPPDTELERWARDLGAVSRFRGVKSASNLLRVALTYGFCGLSMLATGAWGHVSQVAALSKSAIVRKLRKCRAWLEWLVAYKLGERVPAAPVAGLTIRLVDATRIALPGSKGEAWRIHASYDPWTGRLVAVEVTDNHGGERLARFNFTPGEVVVADQGYAHRSSLAYAAAAGARFVVRTNWKNVPLESPDGTPFDLFAALRSLPGQTAGEFSVRIQADESRGLPAILCRLVACRKPPEAAQAAKDKALKEAKKKKVQLDPRTLEAYEYVMVLTTVEPEALDASRILALYRLRWQVELEFKRLKSLLNLDDVRVRNPESVRAALAAKLLGALVVEEIASEADRPADWSLTSILATAVRQAVFGLAGLKDWLFNTKEAAKWLNDGTRVRQPQCKVTRELLLAPS